MGRFFAATTFAALLAWAPSASAQGTCAHDECVEGEPLTEDCSVCAEAVCGSDPFCCNEAWDDECVELADFLCNWCGGGDEAGDDEGGGSSGGDEGGATDDGSDSPGPGDDDDDDDDEPRPDDDDDDDDETGDDDDDEDRGKNDKNDDPAPGTVPPISRGGDAEGCSIGSGRGGALTLLGLALWGFVRRRRVNG